MIPVAEVIRKTFELKPSGSRYLRGIEHDSLVVDKKRNLFFWNSKGIAGDALDWLTEVRGVSHDNAKQLLSKFPKYRSDTMQNSDTGVPVYPKLLDTFFELGKKHRDYWYHRGYSDSTINLYRLGYTGDFYVIPIIKDAELKNFQCRRAEPKAIWSWARGHAPYLFGSDIVDSDYIFFTESPVDAVAMREMRLPAISHNGGAGCWLNKWNKDIVKYDKVYVIYDNDRAGIRGAKKVARKMLGRAYVLFWPSGFKNKFDINAALLKFGKKKAKKLIRGVLVSQAVHSSDLDNLDYRIVQNRLQEKVKGVL